MSREKTEPTNSALSERVSKIFQYMSDFSHGTQDDIEPMDLGLSELVTLTKQYAQQLEASPDNDLLRAKVWGVTCELYYRSRDPAKYPQRNDILNAIIAELLVTDGKTMHLPAKNSFGESNDVSVELLMLRCASVPGKKLDLVDGNFPEAEIVSFVVFKQMLASISPALDSLGSSTVDAGQRMLWRTAAQTPLIVAVGNPQPTEETPDDPVRGRSAGHGA